MDLSSLVLLTSYLFRVCLNLYKEMEIEEKKKKKGI